VFFPVNGEPSIVTISDEEPYARRSWIKNIVLVSLETFDRLGDQVKCTLNVIRQFAKDSGLANGVIGYEGSMEFFSTNYQRREFWAVGPPFYPRRAMLDLRQMDIERSVYMLKLRVV
jgi:hypothetical protein